MENANYTTLARQSGLLRELQVIANNVANISTAGYRREGVIFSEYIKGIGSEGSLSMARGNNRHIDLRLGTISTTGGSLDFAISGSGFFLVSTPEGERLTRSGAFLKSSENTLVNSDGYSLLDDAGIPISLPNNFKSLSVSPDGALSADEIVVATIGVWQAADPTRMQHTAGTLFRADEYELIEGSSVHQGSLEDSNVNAVSEIARMVEVQRNYELGQKFMDFEDQRQRAVISTLGR